jgi:hypothetical protein
MIIKISKTKELEKRLPFKTLDKPEHKKAIEKMNKSMEKVRKDYIIKNSKSEKSSKYVILTQNILYFNEYEP